MEDTDFLLNTSLSDLVALANKARKHNIGPRLEFCTIMNAKSGSCSEDCRFCAQSAHHNTSIANFPLKSVSEIVSEAKKAHELGAVNFGIVTSGNRLSAVELATLTDAISQIQNETGIDICASLGALTFEEMATLKEAGLSRYHHNIETSPSYYPKIVSSHGFSERITTIKAAQQAGLQVCSGGIIGMGESWQDRIEMAQLLKELDVDSVPINILVPVTGTPLDSLPRIPCADIVRTIAIFRLIMPDKTIKIAAGRESVLKDFQAMGFMAGANGMLIGGYLTIKGRAIEDDQQLINEIKILWGA